MTSGAVQVAELTLESELLSCRENASMSRASGAEMAPPDMEVKMTSMNRERARQARAALADIPAQLAALENMDVAALRARYEEVFSEPTRAGNPNYLRKRIAWQIQELDEAQVRVGLRSRMESHAPFPPRGEYRPTRHRAPARTAPAPPRSRCRAPLSRGARAALSVALGVTGSHAPHFRVLM